MRHRLIATIATRPQNHYERGPPGSLPRLRSPLVTSGSHRHPLRKTTAFEQAEIATAALPPPPLLSEVSCQLHGKITKVSTTNMTRMEVTNHTYTNIDTMCVSAAAVAAQTDQTTTHTCPVLQHRLTTQTQTSTHIYTNIDTFLPAAPFTTSGNEQPRTSSQKRRRSKKTFNRWQAVPVFSAVHSSRTSDGRRSSTLCHAKTAVSCSSSISDNTLTGPRHTAT